MTIKPVQRAAELRGIFFNGQREWQNDMVGYGYGAYLPNGYYGSADTLYGFYKMVMEFPRV